MKRIIVANTNSTMNDSDILHTVGRRNYDQLYKQCTFLTDDEICNMYGDIDIEYTNGGCTGKSNPDGTITITSKVYTQFEIKGFPKFSYTELESTFDGNIVSKPRVVYFNDDVEFE